MKARIKDTVEIVEVEHIVGSATYTRKDGGSGWCDTDRLDFNVWPDGKEIDWEQRRYNVAMELFVCAINGNWSIVKERDFDELVRLAASSSAQMADIFIEELKEQSK